MMEMAIDGRLNRARKCAARDAMKPEVFCRVMYDPMHTVIHPSATIGDKTIVGLFSVIEHDAQIGEHCEIGNYCQVGHGAIIGDNAKLGKGVILNPGTHVCDNTIIADNCITTGPCWIGQAVNIRTGAIISKGTVIEDYAFIGPAVVTNHTKHVAYMRPKVKAKVLLTVIGTGAIIGSGVALVAGIDVAPLTIIGAGSVVTKSIEEPAIYVGNPLRRLAELPLNFIIDGNSEFGEDVANHLLKHMPELDVSRIQGV